MHVLLPQVHFICQPHIRSFPCHISTFPNCVKCIMCFDAKMSQFTIRHCTKWHKVMFMCPNVSITVRWIPTADIQGLFRLDTFFSIYIGRTPQHSFSSTIWAPDICRPVPFPFHTNPLLPGRIISASAFYISTILQFNSILRFHGNLIVLRIVLDQSGDDSFSYFKLIIDSRYHKSDLILFPWKACRITGMRNRIDSYA